MMKKTVLLSCLLLFAIVLTACNLPISPQAADLISEDLQDGIADDIQVQPATATPIDDIAAGPGLVSGQLCYPSDFIPPMTLHFLEIGSNQLTSQAHDSGQPSYNIELPAGTYYAFAFRSDADLGGGGGYTEFIACGAQQGCGDQTLEPFVVPAEGQVGDIDICDWVIPEENLPPVPAAAAAIDDLSAGDGQVAGQVCYPSEGIPPLVLHFYNLETEAITSQAHAQNDTDYSQGLPPGSYYAFAFVDLEEFDSGDGGGYTEWVACGQGGECTDHSLRPFEIAAGQTTSEVDICDWFVPAEDLPDIPEPIDDLAPLPTASATAPRNGISLNCDGTYQRLRIVDNGEDGKTVYIDDWQAGAWVTVWSKTPQDPFLQQVMDDVGWYQFGDCQKLVVVPIRNGDPRVTVDLTVHAWNGATMTQVYSNSGWYGTWTKIGDIIRTREASKLGYVDGGPLSACEWLTLEYSWDGDSFDQTGSSIEIVEDCEVSVTDHP